MFATPWTRQFSTDLTMSAGSIQHRQAMEVTSPVFQGLQVIVTLSGRLTGRIDGSAPFEIAEPGAYVVLAAGQHEGRDRFEADSLSQYVKVAIDPDSAERNGFPLDRLAASHARRVHAGDVIVLHQPLTPALKAIATQALACPLQGAMRDVYLAGKGLELAAIATDALLHHDAPQGRLSEADLKRIWTARDMAVAHYQQPLTLHALAREAGTNVNKLAAGFRQVFGLSVFAYIQEHRLQEAYRMLATRAYSVSEVATFVGYAIPHFSTLFRKRYGFAPSQFAGCGGCDDRGDRGDR
ncbi:AraC family transcriptional regulator [Cupriavidus agavae]|uniref:AraC family transcriptional regulator n=1 Tax=Cupriavidus agavae TaxID=1001822 RepID=A0A4Q7RZY7_9BURK|nr:AraC family transcriptional regulator [Cupriavidus agavae]RZT39413.1 AraC family transcriptional regulator [Cupriavidus agavae]